MKNPWMRLWLSTMNSSLEATRAFWANLLRQPTARNRDHASDVSEATTAKEPKDKVPRPPDAPAAELAKPSSAREATNAPEEPGVKAPRKPSGRASDTARGTSASKSTETQRRRGAEPSKS